MKSNKKARGIVTFVALVALLLAALIGSMVNESKITSNVVGSIGLDDRVVHYTEVENIDDLHYLNEGWYEIRQGHVFYLEYFDNAIPIFIKIKNEKEQNGMLVVNADGSTSFDGSFRGLPNGQYSKADSNSKITGEVTGLEQITGNQVYNSINAAITNAPYDKEITINGVKYKKTYGVIPASGLPSSVDDKTPILYRVANPTLGFDNSGNNFLLDNYRGRYELAPDRLNVNSKTPQTVDGITYYFRDDGVYVGAQDRGRQAYDAYRAGQTTAQQGNPQSPPLPGFEGTSATSSPSVPNLIDVSNQENLLNIPTGREIPGNDGFKYGKGINNKIYKLTNGAWVENPVSFTVTGSINGEPVSFNIQAHSLPEANRIANEQWREIGPRVIGVARETQSSATTLSASSRWEVKTLPNQVVYLTNGRGTKKLSEIPEQYRNDLQRYANLLNDQEAIRNRYLEFSNNLRNNGITDETKIFEEYTRGLSDIGKEEVRNALPTTIPSVQRTQERDPRKPIGRYPSGQYIFVYNGQTYTSSDPNAVPADLDAILNFRRDHSTAVEQKDLKTNGKKVYLEKGKYIDELGNDIREGSITQTRKYGDIEVEFTFKTDKNSKFDKTKPDSIKIGDSTISYAVFKEIEPLIKTAKSASGDFETGGLELNDAEGNTIALASLASEEGITDGIKIESFKDGFPSFIKISSQDGKTTYFERWGEVGGLTLPVDYQKKEVDANGRKLTTYGQFQYDQSLNLQMKKEIQKDDLTGEPIFARYIVGAETYSIDYKTGKVSLKSPTGQISDLDVDSLPPELKKQISALMSEHAKWTSRRAIANFERTLTEFRGLGYIPSLFGFDDESLLEWRNEVDKQFAMYNLGTEYWSSKICNSNIDDEGIGVAYAETPSGLAQIGAHIQATRTEPIKNGTRTTYIYKITFNVRNGDYDKDPRAPEELRFNVELIRSPSTQQDTAVPRVLLFSKELNVSRGATYGRTGDDAIVKESSTLYTQICMKFTSQIPSKWKISNNELCTPIQESATTPTKVRQVQGQPTSNNNDDPNMNDF